MSALYVAVLVVIAGTLLAVAFFRALRVKTKADYLVAGRSLSAFVLVLTLLTSWIGAGSLFAARRTPTVTDSLLCGCRPAAGWDCSSSISSLLAPAALRSSPCLT